jgi:hypothetical protein
MSVVSPRFSFLLILLNKKSPKEKNHFGDKEVIEKFIEGSGSG